MRHRVTNQAAAALTYNQFFQQSRSDKSAVKSPRRTGAAPDAARVTTYRDMLGEGLERSPTYRPSIYNNRHSIDAHTITIY